MSMETATTECPTTPCQLRSRLCKFMARPQRHRLLHGYPLAAAMPYADAEVRHRAANGDPAFVLPRNPTNELLVGVLPHRMTEHTH